MSEYPQFLILEDDIDFREGLVMELAERGFDTYGADNWQNLDKERLESTEFALVDLKLNRDNGLNCMKSLKDANPEMRIVLITGYGTVSTAVEAMKKGAHNYITKPASIDDILDALFDDEEDDEDDDSTASLAAKAQRTSLARHEKEYIEYVLARCSGNITHAAEWLGIRRQSLQRKLKKYPPNR
ncbi:MAG: response regulator [Pseudobacteriovorax sp.]|nr:response regulator [Pseudobacteriovorax sp.]